MKKLIYIGALACLLLTGCQDSDELAGGGNITEDNVIHLGGISTDGLVASAVVTRTDPPAVDEENVQRTDAENISWLVGPLKDGLDITYGKNGNPRTNERVAILKLLTNESDGSIKYSEDPVTHDKVAEYSFLYRDNENGEPTENPAIWYDNGAHYFEGLYIPTRIKYRNEAYGSDPAQTITDVYGTGGSAEDLTTDQHDDNTAEANLGNYTLLSRYLGMPSNFTLNATVARIKLPFRHRLARVLAYILIDPDMGEGVTIDGYKKDANGNPTTTEDATTSKIRFCNVNVLGGVKDSYNSTTQHHTYTPQWMHIRKVVPHYVGERGSYDDSQNQSLNDQQFISFFDTQKKEYIYPTDAQWATLNGLAYDATTNTTSNGDYERTLYGKVPVYDLIVQPTYTSLDRVMYDEDLSIKSKQDYYVATNQIEFEITLSNGLQYAKRFEFDLDANYQTVVYLRISRERVDYNSSGSDLWVETTGYDDWYGVNNQNGNTLSFAGSGWQRAYTNGATTSGHPNPFDDIVTDGHYYTHDSEDEEAQYVTDAKWIEMLREACVGGKHHGDYFILHNDISIPAAAFPTDFVFTGHLDGLDHTITLTDASYTPAHDEYEPWTQGGGTKYVEVSTGNYAVFTPDVNTTYCDDNHNVISNISSYSGSTAYIRTVASTTYQVVDVGSDYTSETFYKKENSAYVTIDNISDYLSSKGTIYTKDAPTYSAVALDDLVSSGTYYRLDGTNYVKIDDISTYIGTVYTKNDETYSQVTSVEDLVSDVQYYNGNHDPITIGPFYTKNADSYTAVISINALTPSGTYYKLEGGNYIQIANINTYICIYRQVITYNYEPIAFYKFVHYEPVIGSSTGASGRHLFFGLNGKYSTAQESNASATWEANVHKESGKWVPYKCETDGWRAEIINTNISGGTLFPTSVVYGTDITGYVHNCWEGGTSYDSTTHKWTNGTRVDDYTPSLPEY